MVGLGVLVLPTSCEAPSGEARPGTQAVPFGTRRVTSSEEREGALGTGKALADLSLRATTTPFGVGLGREEAQGMRLGIPMCFPLSGCSPLKRRSKVRAREYVGVTWADFWPFGLPLSHSARSRRGKWQRYPAHLRHQNNPAVTMRS